MKPNPINVHNGADEHRQVRHDLRFVIVLNALFFVLLLGLYFWNRSTGAVDSFFGNLLKF